MTISYSFAYGCGGEMNAATGRCKRKCSRSKGNRMKPIHLKMEKLFIGLERSNIHEFISKCCETGISLEPPCRVYCGRCGKQLQDNDIIHEHIDSPDCWCEPELDYEDPETGNRLWIHKEIQ